MAVGVGVPVAVGVGIAVAVAVGAGGSVGVGVSVGATIATRGLGVEVGVGVTGCEHAAAINVHRVSMENALVAWRFIGGLVRTLVIRVHGPFYSMLGNVPYGLCGPA